MLAVILLGSRRSEILDYLFLLHPCGLAAFLLYLLVIMFAGYALITAKEMAEKWWQTYWSKTPSGIARANKDRARWEELRSELDSGLEQERLLLEAEDRFDNGCREDELMAEFPREIAEEAIVAVLQRGGPKIAWWCLLVRSLDHLSEEAWEYRCYAIDPSTREECEAEEDIPF